MSGRIKSGLSLLLMLLVFAASSQAAVCELACGLGTQGVVCHTPASASEDVASSAMPGMSHSHCVPAKHGDGVQAKSSAAQAGTASFAASHDMQCHHYFAPAIVETSATGVHLADIHLTVVEVMSIRAMLTVTRLVVLQSLPTLYTPLDSRLVTLRI